MITLLYGPDSYRRTKRLNFYIEVFRKKYPSASIEEFDLGDKAKRAQEVLRLREFISTKSMFADKKMAVLQNAWSAPGSKRGKKSEASGETKIVFDKDFKAFLKLQLKDSDSFLVFSEEKAVPPDLAFLKAKPTTIEKLEELSPAELKSYVKSESKALGATVDDKALDFLIGFYESDLWAIITEIGRLRWFYPSAKTALIDMDVLKKAGDYFISEDIFPFVQALSFPGSIGEKLSMYENMVLSREEPLKVFNILQSFNYLSPELLTRLADYDIMVKSGRMDYDDVLLDLIIGQ